MNEQNANPVELFGMRVAHVGINATDPADALEIAELFSTMMGMPIIVENSSAISRASAGSVALMPTWATRMPKSSTGLAFCSFMQAAPTEP